MLKVGIVGATGYGGEELIKLLLTHSQVQITALAAKMEGKKTPCAEIFPAFRGKLDLICVDLNVEEMSAETDLVFLALPHKISLNIAADFLSRGKKVIDFSADYRLQDSATYEKWYGIKHTQKELLQEAVYGIPELYRPNIQKARLIANPGCYPTSITLGIAPLLAKGLVDSKNIIADSKSGFSGAGRWPGKDFLENVKENFKAYKVASHSHQPEIEEQLSKLSGQKITITFTPHLVPMERGILSTIYLNLKKASDTETLLQLYRDFYQGKPFIKILPADKLPETKAVSGTNFCHLGLRVDKPTGKVIVLSAIDNLIKGASGQALQNMNIMYGFPEKEGFVI